MDLISLRDDLRAFLNTRPLTEAIKETGINRSWLSKFRCGKWETSDLERLQRIAEYRTRVTRKGRQAA